MVDLKSKLPRNLAFDLVRSTEASALAAVRWMGLGQPGEADRVATQLMLDNLNQVDMDGTILMGEIGPGRSEELQHGQSVGTGTGPSLDVVIDAIDGRAQLSQGYPGALSAAAIAPAGSLWAPIGGIYMDKIIVDAEVASYLECDCMGAPAAWTLALVARAKKVKVSALTVFVLDRPRHQELISEIRATGAHMRLAPDGDITGGLMACTTGSGVDILMGVGGIPEGLLTACAVKAPGGAMMGQLAPQSDQERRVIEASGFDLKHTFTLDEMVASDEVFFAATGINDGPVLSGVRFHGERAETNSIFMRAVTKTRRLIHSEHLLLETNDQTVYPIVEK